MTLVLPWSDTVEQSLLGAVLIKPEIIGWLEVDDGCFHGPQNRAVWAAMISLHRRGLEVDTAVLEAELESRGVLKAAGGLAYISRLAVNCVSSANASTYASTLEEFRITRDVMRTAADVQASKLAGEELLDAMMSQLGGIRRAKVNEQTSVEDTMPEMVRRLIDDVDSMAKGSIGSSYIPTGVKALDRKVGGAPCGTVTAIGGRPGAGKSSLLLALAKSAASLGKVAAVFTTEDPRDRWNERLLAAESRVAVDRIYTRRLNPEELARLTQAADAVRALKNLHIVHAHGMGAQEIVREAMVLGADFVGVDYIQKVKAPERGMQLHEAIEANSKTLGDYAGKSGAVMAVLSQMSKETEKEDRRPRVSDMRYADGLAQEAKLIVLLHDPKNANDSRLRELLIAKRNQGLMDLVVEAGFEGQYCEFFDRLNTDTGGDSDEF